MTEKFGGGMSNMRIAKAVTLGKKLAKEGKDLRGKEGNYDDRKRKIRSPTEGEGKKKKRTGGINEGGENGDEDSERTETDSEWKEGSLTRGIRH